MKVLGIESSCDETAAAIVEDGKRLLSNVVHSQIDIHTQYGGVVPEIAARSHIEMIQPVISRALQNGNCTWRDIDAIAVTYAPGLVGSLLVGTLAARTLALLHNKPLYAIHHIEAHVYANFITTHELPTPLELPQTPPAFPLLALIVSGGHTQLMLFTDHGKYTILGQTQDDAIGEAFDKVAKIIGLPYPGGPSIAEAAKKGDKTRFSFPKAKMKGPYDFSFSGLKTAVLRTVQKEVGVDFTYPSHKLPELVSERLRDDIAASFQHVAIQTVVQKTAKAFSAFSPRSVVIAGGVAANRELRAELAHQLPIPIQYAPVELCTDNAAMVAALGYYKARRAEPTDPLHLDVQPSLTLSPTITPYNVV